MSNQLNLSDIKLLLQLLDFEIYREMKYGSTSHDDDELVVLYKKLMTIPCVDIPHASTFSPSLSSQVGGGETFNDDIPPSFLNTECKSCDLPLMRSEASVYHGHHSDCFRAL